jgi:inner membrane protein
VDPLTQTGLGASLALSRASRRALPQAALAGGMAGAAPDLDVLIRSAEDPLLFLEYHRQFTHSLVFIPFGAALVALLLWLLIGRRRGWSATALYGFCFLGYATHALLDACTSYGTQLLWPFSDRRFAWNNVSIIDPLLTLPLLLFIALALIRRRPVFATTGFAWVVLYLGLGVLARDVAIEEGLRLAAERGHYPDTLEAKPSFGNIVLWKTVYRWEDTYHVDALRIAPSLRVYPGARVAALDPARDLPWLDADSTQARDLERFRWFSMGYLAAEAGHPGRVMDLRYSLLPNEVRPLWAIELDPAAPPGAHVRYVVERGADGSTWAAFVAMLAGRPPQEVAMLRTARP